MFSLLFLNIRVGRLLTIRPSFNNWAFLAVLRLLRGDGAGLAPNPQPGEPECLSSSGFFPLTCPAWVSLPVVYATAGIALGVMEALKLPHHVKVETPSGEL